MVALRYQNFRTQQLYAYFGGSLSSVSQVKVAILKAHFLDRCSSSCLFSEINTRYFWNISGESNVNWIVNNDSRRSSPGSTQSRPAMMEPMEWITLCLRIGSCMELAQQLWLVNPSDCVLGTRPRSVYGSSTWRGTTDDCARRSLAASLLFQQPACHLASTSNYAVGCMHCICTIYSDSHSSVTAFFYVTRHTRHSHIRVVMWRRLTHQSRLIFHEPSTNRPEAPRWSTEMEHRAWAPSRSTEPEHRPEHRAGAPGGNTKREHRSDLSLSW